MDEYVGMVNKWYTKAGRGSELHELKVPVGGDQLTRVRLQGAKSLRAGSLTRSERLEILDPIVVELFHTLQDFLEKLCKKFLNLKNGRDGGTLPSLKVLIKRANVNGKVKGRFKAHEDFVLTCGEGYFLSFILNHFGMITVDDRPVHPLLNDKLSSYVNEKKRPIFNTIMNEILDKLLLPFKMQDKKECIDVKMTVMSNPPTTHMLQCKVNGNDEVNVNFEVNNHMVTLCLTSKMITNKCIVNSPQIPVQLKFEEYTNPQDDDLHNYVINFLQWYFVIIQLKDAIHEGDLERTNIILKCMIPFFYSHSTLSKYFVECIDYILKTENTLSEQQALKVRAASFVNTAGGKGCNKAADMQKENEVKMLKDLIRGLGANKTESSILNITKAAVTITSVCENYDRMVNIKKIKTNHKTKSRKEDIDVIIPTLSSLDLWNIKHGRMLQGKVTKNPFTFSRERFSEDVQRTVNRLIRDIPIDVDPDSDNDSDTDVSDSDLDDD